VTVQALANQHGSRTRWLSRLTSTSAFRNPAEIPEEHDRMDEICPDLRRYGGAILARRASLADAARRLPGNSVGGYYLDHASPRHTTMASTRWPAPRSSLRTASAFWRRGCMWPNWWTAKRWIRIWPAPRPSRNASGRRSHHGLDACMRGSKPSAATGNNRSELLGISITPSTCPEPPDPARLLALP